MTTPPQKCPKCDGEMEQGFVIDNTHGVQLVSQWAPGSPRRSFWTGIKKTEEQISIGTYRCSSCGFLESYARTKFAAK